MEKFENKNNHPYRRDIDLFFFEIEGRIEKIIEKKIDPLTKLLEKHDTALYSKDGTNGICRDINDIKNTVKNFKAFSYIISWIIGILTSIFAFFGFIKKTF